jgi:hypothetical protein
MTIALPSAWRAPSATLLAHERLMLLDGMGLLRRSMGGLRHV